MGREARINKAKRERAANAFRETDEGKRAMEFQRQQQIDAAAAQISEQLGERAAQATRYRLIAHEFERLQQLPVVELLAAAEEVCGVCAKATPQPDFERLWGIVKIAEVVRIVVGQRQEVDRRDAAHDGTSYTQHQRDIIDRSHRFALAEAIGRVTQRDMPVRLPGGPGGWWDVAASATPAPVSQSPASEASAPDAKASQPEAA